MNTLVNSKYSFDVFKRRESLYNGGVKIHKRLSERRSKAGLTQGQVSAYEGISPQHLSNLETGRRQPNSWPLLAALARRYRTTADYLLGLTDNPEPPSDVVADPEVLEMVRRCQELEPTRRREIMLIIGVMLEAQDEERAERQENYTRLYEFLENREDGEELVRMASQLLTPLLLSQEENSQDI